MLSPLLFTGKCDRNDSRAILRAFDRSKSKSAGMRILFV